MDGGWMEEEVIHKGNPSGKELIYAETGRLMMR